MDERALNEELLSRSAELADLVSSLPPSGGSGGSNLGEIRSLLEQVTSVLRAKLQSVPATPPRESCVAMAQAANEQCWMPVDEISSAAMPHSICGTSSSAVAESQALPVDAGTPAELGAQMTSCSKTPARHESAGAGAAGDAASMSGGVSTPGSIVADTFGTVDSGQTLGNIDDIGTFGSVDTMVRLGSDSNRRSDLRVTPAAGFPGTEGSAADADPMQCQDAESTCTVGSRSQESHGSKPTATAASRADGTAHYAEPGNVSATADYEGRRRSPVETQGGTDRVGCADCGKLLKTSSLKSHMLTQHAQPRVRHHQTVQNFVECNVCGKMLREASLQLHIRLLHSDGSESRVACAICGKMLKPASMNTHVYNQHGPGNQKESDDDSSSDADDDPRPAGGSRPAYDCMLCPDAIAAVNPTTATTVSNAKSGRPFVVTKYGRLLRHVKTCHLLVASSSATGSTTGTSDHRRGALACPMCEKALNVSGTLKDGYQRVLHHMSTEHGRALPVYFESALCHQCDYSTYSCKLLKDHITYNHGERSGDERKKACPICGKRVVAVYLKRHVDAVHGRSVVVEGAVATSERPRGNDVPTALEPLTCAHCGKSIVGAHNLARHVKRMHLKQKDHLCHLCPAQFFEKKELHVHLFAKHDINASGKGVISCPRCNDFHTIHREALNKHVLTHQTSREHTCERCCKSFKTRAVLKQHCLVMHERTRVFSCAHCSFTSHAKQYLQRHAKIHASEKRYRCDVCSYASHFLENVKKHMKNVHCKGSAVAPPAAADKQRRVVATPSDLRTARALEAGAYGERLPQAALAVGDASLLLQVGSAARQSATLVPHDAPCVVGRIQGTVPADGLSVVPQLVSVAQDSRAVAATSSAAQVSCFQAACCPADSTGGVSRFVAVTAAQSGRLGQQQLQFPHELQIISGDYMALCGSYEPSPVAQ